MKRNRCFVSFFCLFFFTTPATSFAHHSGDHEVVLHTNDKWDECAMVIDPSLTQAQWRTFTRDVASIVYFRPTNGAMPLGKGKFDIAMESSLTSPLKDYNDSWNNTFSHPYDTHWLVGDDHRLEVPVVTARYGIDDKLEAGIIYTNNFEANYGWSGVDVKYAFFHDPGRAVYGATRLSTVMLTGVADLDYYQVAVDLLVAKRLGMFTPYAGIAGLYSIAKEVTSKVDLADESYLSAEAIIGSQMHWKHLSIAAEIDFARINMYGLKVGATF